MASSTVRIPSLLDFLPPATLDSVYMAIDSSAVHNWRCLVDHLKDYTYQDIMELSIVERRGESASKSLLHDLNSRGWTVVDLAELAVKAGAMEVVSILQDYCKEYCPDVVLPKFQPPAHGGFSDASGRGSDTPTQPLARIDTGWKSAKSCFHRHGYPATIAPPLDAMEEAQRRYGVNPAAGGTNEILEGGGDGGCGLESPLESIGERNLESRGSSQMQSHDTSCDVSLSLESLPTSDLIEVAYGVLKEACGHFADLAYHDGGHKLGSGGFGEVFHCHLNLLGTEREVAVKALLTKDELLGVAGVSEASMESTERRQFTTEIKALSNLNHPHLLPVLGYSCDGPRLCLIFPYMANGSLDAHLSDRLRLTPEVRVQVACDVASALSYLHSGASHTVIHRDVKSANILLTGEWRGMLGDFGVARSLPTSAHTSVHTTTVVGTRVYMSDEFSKGTISPAADTYAFGVVLFELLTGFCAMSVKTPSGEITDLISFIDDCDDIDELMGGDWAPHEGAWHSTWTLAESCANHIRRRRPPTTEVWTKLEQILTTMRTTA